MSGAGGAARPAVVRGWAPPPTPYAAGHRGVDLAARAGQPVRAAAAGTVSFAAAVGGRGVVVIRLTGTGGPSRRTTYEPVRARVRAGDRVRAGEVVGTLEEGPFHCFFGCLHWGLLEKDRYLDPLSLLPPRMLRGGPSRLLPVFGVPLTAPEPAPLTTGRLAPAAASSGTAALVPGTAAPVAAVVLAMAVFRARGRPRLSGRGGLPAGLAQTGPSAPYAVQGH